MNNKIKKAVSTFTAICFTFTTLSFTNPSNINAKENKNPSYLSGVEINARFINRYCDWGKYDLNLYNE